MPTRAHAITGVYDIRATPEGVIITPLEWSSVRGGTNGVFRRIDSVNRFDPDYEGPLHCEGCELNMKHAIRPRSGLPVESQ